MRLQPQVSKILEKFEKINKPVLDHLGFGFEICYYFKFMAPSNIIYFTIIIHYIDDPYVLFAPYVLIIRSPLN